MVNFIALIWFSFCSDIKNVYTTYTFEYIQAKTICIPTINSITLMASLSQVHEDVLVYEQHVKGKGVKALKDIKVLIAEERV